MCTLTSSSGSELFGRTGSSEENHMIKLTPGLFSPHHWPVHHSAWSFKLMGLDEDSISLHGRMSYCLLHNRSSSSNTSKLNTRLSFKWDFYSNTFLRKRLYILTERCKRGKHVNSLQTVGDEAVYSLGQSNCGINRVKMSIKILIKTKTHTRLKKL